MKVTVGDAVYDFDPSQVRNKTLISIERFTGMTAPEWEDACTRGSALALTALVWAVRVQNGETDLAFDDVDFDLREVEVEQPGEEPEVAADVEPGKDPAAESPAS